MSEQVDSRPIDAPGRSRIWPLFMIVGLLVISPACLHLLAARADEGVEWLRSVTHGGSVDRGLKEGDCKIIQIAHFLRFSMLQDSDIVQVATTLNSVQKSVGLIVISLVLFHFYPLVPLLRKLVLFNLGTLLIGAELILVFWLVHGGMAGMGMPGLFWSEAWQSQMMAACGVAIFCSWMFFLIFVRNFEHYRHEPDLRIWTRVRPILEQSGLTRLVRRDVENAGPAEQLGWFLVYTGLPLLVLLILPAVLPVERPGNVSRVVDWSWLAGLGLVKRLMPSVKGVSSGPLPDSNKGVRL